MLAQLPPAQLNLTNSINNTGNVRRLFRYLYVSTGLQLTVRFKMYEKFSNLNVDSSGYGGEYTVQVGFGWTNGVMLWVAANYGQVLVAPQCPPLIATATSAGLRLSPSSMTVAVLVSLVGVFLL